MVARLSGIERDAIATRLIEIDAELLVLHNRADTRNSDLASQWGQLYREMYALEQRIGGTRGSQKVVDKTASAQGRSRAQ